MANESNKKSVYVKDELWQEAEKTKGSLSMSQLISELLQKWLNGEVSIVFEVKQEDDA